MTPLAFRSGYARSDDGLPEIARLILDVFDVDVSPLDRLGHDPSVVAFGWWSGDDLVANVSLFDRRLTVMGETVSAFGVQSVAVRPQWRGRGLFRDLMQRALAYADARADLVTLTTGTPDLYTPFGFRQVLETAGRAPVASGAAEPQFRSLSLDSDADVAFLLDMFARRAPTSRIACACDHPALFLLKAKETPQIELLHLPGLDAVVAVKARDRPTMTLLDIVAPSIPSVDAIVSALAFSGERIDVRLTADLLSWLPEERKRLDNGHMLRGPFAAEAQPFMLSEMHA